MATPWADPRSGLLYLRRQIPEALRQAFGGRAVYKVALKTRDPLEGRAAFARENAVFEELLATARREVAEGRVAPTPEGLVSRWFAGHSINGGLDGPQRLLLALMQVDSELGSEVDAVEWLRDPVPPRDTDWAAVEQDRQAFDSLLTQYYEDSAARVGSMWKACRGADPSGSLTWPYAKAVAMRLLRSTVATAPPSVDAVAEALSARFDLERDWRAALRPQPAVPARRSNGSRLRPAMRFRQLFQEWKNGNGPSTQTALEYEAAVEDFINFAGDPAVSHTNADLLYDYRDEAAKLPRSMPRADRALPFSERVARYANAEPKVSAATLKKRIGALQALITYAHQQRWISDNVGRGIQIIGYTKSRRKRRSFMDEELASLFSAPLFADRSSWESTSSRISDCTIYWLFLLGLTTGARLEEVGQAALTDVREDGDLVYLDIDIYSLEPDVSKSLKTEDSIRLVPIHRKLVDLGFLHYRDALIRRGQSRLFPDLVENSIGKRTKEASQRANRVIDRWVSNDRRLVFHSLRHTFKAKGNDAGITDRTLDQICGHSPTGVAGRYGSEPRVRTIHRELHRIDLSCIDWSLLEVGKRTTNWFAVVTRMLERVQTA